MNPIVEKSIPSATVTIFIAGSIDQCKLLLAEAAAERGACWSVEPTEFIYTGGREVGCVVRSINYPRFPKSEVDLMEEGLQTARMLLVRMFQGSCSVVGPKETVWLSRRGDAS